jgi:cation diffusion facilitator family transporter
MTTGPSIRAEKIEAERRGLQLSILGSVFMAVLGLVFAALTDSRAVLLDGLFSLIGAAVGVVAMRVAVLVRRADDDRFHFGYAAYEPMLNLTKGLLIGFVSLIAAWASVESLLAGGREIRGALAVVYALIAAVGCLAISWSQRRLAGRTNSPLLEVDAKNWLIDGLMSGAVAVGFVLVVLLEGTPWSWMTPYADPVVVLVLVGFSLPIPIAIIRSNWSQLLGRAPDAEAQHTAADLVRGALEGEPGLELQIRLLETGRFIYMQVYVLVGTDHPGLDLDQADRLRQRIASAVWRLPQTVGFDIIFTRQQRWLDQTTGPSPEPSTETREFQA